MFYINLENLVLKGNAESADVFGKIHIQAGEFCFPYKDWTDFISTIVLWWAHEFEQMNKLGLKQCELTFMDGDYAVVLVNNGHLADLRFMHGDSCVRMITGVDKGDIEASIRKACATVNNFLESCHL